jgi:hypothetical protein
MPKFCNSCVFSNTLHTLIFLSSLQHKSSTVTLCVNYVMMFLSLKIMEAYLYAVEKWKQY